ncbi:hypothetical protein NQ272_27830, partial [Escherichia coli]|nr:hypothetical protein [Escherichia coli]
SLAVSTQNLSNKFPYSIASLKFHLLQPHFVGKERALSGLVGLDAKSKAWSVVTSELPFLNLEVHSE